ncbi:HlyD family efflux transporter periplasmic adaptor subunit [Allocoleopsis sp.]|uniref:HlyD family efflux transporter periplasmic adaptor subunit n=1 Tax=Allocoleopsis sp. TaxID=3088169 RepID=UPI002FD0D003
MPNPSSLQDHASRNGHYRPNQSVSSEEPIDFSDPSPTPSSTQPSSSHMDDWSPLTQELIDTLPKVWTRGLLYFLVVFTGIVLPWAMLSKVDETGSARGRLEPKGATQRLDAPAIGTVTEVSVKEGQTVKAGQVLLKLESDLLRSELQQVETKLEGQQNRLAQLQLIESQLMIAIRAQQQQNQAQGLEKQAQIEQAKTTLTASKTAYTLQDEKLAQVEQARESIAASKTAYALADSRFTKDMAEVERYRKLLQDGVISKVKVVEIERLAEESRRLRAQAEADIKQAEARLKERQGSYQKMIHQAQAEIEQASSRLKEQESGYQSLMQGGKLAVLKSEEQLKDLQTQITTLQSEIAQSKSQVKSLKLQLEQRVIRAPRDGTIFQLPIQRAGAVVEPGQMLAQIAPKGVELIFKAQVPISQSGFLHKGMPVKLKFDAYPFQDYGVVPGHLHWISPDSKPIQTAQGQTEMYELEIAVDCEHIETPNKHITLNAGQTATAEVVIRQRRIIDFILDPFKQLQKGGLKL